MHSCRCHRRFPPSQRTRSPSWASSRTASSRSTVRLCIMRRACIFLPRASAVSLSLEHTHTHTHKKKKHARTLSLCPSFSHSLSLSHTHTPSLSLTLSLPLDRSTVYHASRDAWYLPVAGVCGISLSHTHTSNFFGSLSFLAMSCLLSLSVLVLFLSRSLPLSVLRTLSHSHTRPLSHKHIISCSSALELSIFSKL